MPAPEESYELDRDCPRCWHCDDMGDVHRADGEWLGICSCAAGDRQRAESEYRSWFPIAAGVPASRWCHECMVNVKGPCSYKECPVGVTVPPDQTFSQKTPAGSEDGL